MIVNEDQTAAVDGGHPGIGIRSGEGQCARAGLRQTITVAAITNHTGERRAARGVRRYGDGRAQGDRCGDRPCPGSSAAAGRGEVVVQ